MEDNLELSFCEICNESIPLTDLESKAALTVKGKVIGPCCLGDIQQPQIRGGMSGAGMSALGAVLLAAIAGATIHLEWRLSDQVGKLDDRVAEVEGNVQSAGARTLTSLEKSLDGTVRQGELEPLVQRVAKLESKVESGDRLIGAKLATTAARLGGLDETQQKILSGQVTIGQAVQGVEKEVLRLERDVAAAAAAPRGVAEVVSDAVARPKMGAGEAEMADTGLPAALSHQVSRLKDGDAGNRFEAVDQLVQSKHKEVLPHLLPMLKDSDAFVRRLTAEGLASFRDKTTVDALLIALADPESIVRHTAHASLKKLTGQDIAFDADGSGRSRAAAQRKWKDWWAKNRGAY